jgi:DNA ligase-associated metallophosphoesterase
VFRRAGIAVPRGGTTQDLQRLDALVESSGARELYVLGDLLHGPVPEAAWREAWLRWRARRPALRVAVLAGNHDRRLAQAGLDVEPLPPSVQAAPFQLAHLPPASTPGEMTLCGHLHPVVRIEGRRWPCFWFRDRKLVLPAFSAFTGGHALEAGDGWLGVCVPDAVISLGTPPR